jgi:hypothetical protein
MNQQWGPKGCAGWGPFDAVTNALRQPRRVASQLAVAMVRDWLTVLAVPCGSVILTAPPRPPVAPVASMTLRQTVVRCTPYWRATRPWSNSAACDGPGPILAGMQPSSVPMPLTRPVGWSGGAAVTAGAAMGALVGARVACALAGWLLDSAGCAPAGAPAGVLVGAFLALVVLPLLGQRTRRGEHAAHHPAPTTTTAVRLVWLAIAAALGRWLAEAVVNRQMGLEGLLWLAILPVVLVAAAGLAMVAQGLVRRRGWARWAAVVACSLLGVTALVQVVDWIRALVRSRTLGWWGPATIDLVTAVLFLTVSVGVVVLLMTPATSRDFRSSRQPPAGTTGR